jgi:hypothetical protein
MDVGRNTIRGRGEDANFSFVHIERPGATVDQRVRRQVKSHVSRLQHRQERERQFAVKRSKDLDKSSGTTSSNTRDSSKSSKTVATIASITRDLSESSADSQTALPTRRLSTRRLSSRRMPTLPPTRRMSTHRSRTMATSRNSLH